MATEITRKQGIDFLTALGFKASKWSTQRINKRLEKLAETKMENIDGDVTLTAAQKKLAVKLTAGEAVTASTTAVRVENTQERQERRAAEAPPASPRPQGGRLGLAGKLLAAVRSSTKLTKVVEKANAEYVAQGGKDNAKEAGWSVRSALTVLEAAGVVKMEGENVVKA